MNEREAKAGRGDGSGESFQVGQRLASLAGTQRVLEAIISSRPRQRQPGRPAAGRCRQWTDADQQGPAGPADCGKRVLRRYGAAGRARSRPDSSSESPHHPALTSSEPSRPSQHAHRVPPAMAELQTPALSDMETRRELDL